MIIKDNWKKDEKLDCLLFFALRVHELLFDYTFDSYKPPALNSTTICNEALQLIKDIEEEHISITSIDPVLKELSWKVKGDPVVKSLIKDRLDLYLHWGDFNNLKDIKIKIELLFQKLNSLRYLQRAEEMLKTLIVENKQKGKIYEIASNYISALLTSGFSQGYLFHSLNTKFFRNTPIKDHSILDEFFECFHHEAKRFEVVIRCHEMLMEVNGPIHDLKSKIVSDYSAKNNLPKEINYLITSKKTNEVFFVCDDIIAKDHLKAKEKAEMKLNKITRFLNFFHHKDHPSWSDDALIYDYENPSELLVANSATSYMKKASDMTKEKAAKYLNITLKSLEFAKHSSTKFNRAIDLHGLSVENKYVENQLMQNWIAFETLLVGYSKKSKIEQVINHLMPFLRNNYIERIVIDFKNSLHKHDPKLFREVMNQISDGSSLTDKVAALISFEKYKDLRSEIYSNCEKNPLLKWRLSTLNSNLKTGKSVMDMIIAHTNKAEWHIKRMYRTRNLIVHAGRVPPFTNTLVENSHTYLDILLDTMIILSIKYFVYTIEQCIREIEIEVQRHDKLIKDNYEKIIDETNFRLVFFAEVG